jgi:hypothetical protein
MKHGAQFVDCFCKYPDHRRATAESPAYILVND